MARNARVAGERSAWRIWLFSVIATAALIAVGFLLPERRSLNYLGPVIGAWGMCLWYRKAQGQFFGQQFPEAGRASWWRAIGISLLVMLGLLLLLVISAFIYPGTIEQT